MQKATQHASNFVSRFFVWLACKLVRLYQLTLSPMLGPRCRFYPSCSQYAMESIQQQGLLRGLGASAIRLAKCHPGHPGGIDLPVKTHQSNLSSVDAAKQRHDEMKDKSVAACCSTLDHKPHQHQRSSL